MNKNVNHEDRWITWTTRNRYVDIHTGEELTKHQVKLNYITLTKTKRHEVNYNRTRGIVEITNECERTIQGKLFE